MKKLSYLLFLLLLVIVPSKCYALNEVNIYFFTDNSSISEQERVYLQALKTDRYPNMRIYTYNINENNNSELLAKARKMYNITNQSIPLTVVGDKAFVGFNQNMKGDIQHMVYTYSNNSYQNKFGKEEGINYDNKLTGTVKEYRDKDNYVVEEKSGNKKEVVEENTDLDKYRISIILASIGLFLLIVYVVLRIMEKNK